MAVGWLAADDERSLRAALRAVVPDLAELPLVPTPRHAASNPAWWSASAVIDGRFVVKYAWSEVRALLLWREAVVLDRLRRRAPSLPLPEVTALSTEPALLVTRVVEGAPLSWEWAGRATPGETAAFGDQLAGFLVGLHAVAAADVLHDLPVVEPTPQATTTGLRDGLVRLVDDRRGAAVLAWCTWVDDVLRRPVDDDRRVLVHGDLHGYNQLWHEGSTTLLAVVDYEGCGLADLHFDLRYLPGNAPSLDLVHAVVSAYEHRSGRRLELDRVMAWHVLTVLGDALWRTQAGVALPGGGTASTWIDELAVRLEALGYA